MKTLKLKRVVALLVSAVAMFVANTCSSMCLIWVYDDVEMPESLYKK